MKKATGGAKSIRVFLVDDHPLVRQALRDAMRQERDMEVCGEADDKDAALKGIAAAEPDLAIVDLRLRTSDGLELIRDLRDQHPKVLILVLSMQDESMTAERAFVTSSKTVFSWAAYPFTVLTKFGIRSSRRFSCTVMSLQASSACWFKRTKPL